MMSTVRNLKGFAYITVFRRSALPATMLIAFPADRQALNALLIRMLCYDIDLLVRISWQRECGIENIEHHSLPGSLARRSRGRCR